MKIAEYRIIGALFNMLIEITSGRILFCDNKGKINDFDNKFCETVGYERCEILGKNITNFLDENSRRIFKQNLSSNKSHFLKYELSFVKKDKSKVYTSVLTKHVYDSENYFKGNLSIIIDITELKNASSALETKTLEIEKLNDLLEGLKEKNNRQTANIEKNIISVINAEIYPHLRRLKKYGLHEKQKEILILIESTFNDLIHSFSSKAFDVLPFTPAEYKVIKMIKEGKSSKEISDLLCVSERTVDTHRFHIRKKLGISKQKINLSSYIRSIKL